MINTQSSDVPERLGASLARASARIDARAKLTTLALAVSWPTLLLAVALSTYLTPGVNLLPLLGATFLLALLPSVLVTSAAMRLVRQLGDQLCAAAHRVRQDQDFGARVGELGDAELDRSGAAFNGMLARLDVRDRELDKHRRQLEATLAERTEERDHQAGELRAVLDSMEQGVVLLDRAAMPSSERNAVFDRWFGAPEPGQTFGRVVARAASPFGQVFDQQWQQLIDGFLPVELNVAQLPRTLSTENGRHYRLAYRTLGQDPERFERLLVIVSDITESVEHAQHEAEHSQLLGLLEQLSLDRGGFSNFFAETEQLIAHFDVGDLREPTVIMRELHTLKANFALFGLKPLAMLVNEIEDACAASGQPPSEEDRLELSESWLRFANRARPFLAERAPSVSVDRRALERVLNALSEQRPAAEIAALAGRLMSEPVAPKLARMGERARTLALRLGKGPVQIAVEAEGVVAPSHLGWLWRVLPLVVANSVDHGLDEHTERVAHGKPAEGKLRIAAIERSSSLIIEVEDDGRGVDWERVRVRAQKLGLPARTHEELVSALFADNLSSREQADELAGRGVGLAAVEAACQQHGASVSVVSEHGKGTLFRFVVDSANDTGTRPEKARLRTGAA